MAQRPKSALRPFSLLALCVALAALVVAGCGSDDSDSSGASGASASATETQSVQLLLPATLGLNWSAFLVAQERFWPEAGLDVEGVGTDGSSAVVQQLVSGNATYGVAGAGAVYQADVEGADVRGIAVLTHDDVARLSVPEADTEVESAADLKGKSIGITSAGDGSIPIVEAVMEDAGVSKDEYEMPIVGAGGPAVANAFQGGRIQAYAHGVSDVAGLEIAGDTPLRSIMPEEYVGVPGNVMAVTQETLDDPDKRKVAIALARGWLEAAQFVLDDPEGTREIACEAVPQACTDDAQTELAIELAGGTTEPLDPEQPGAIDYEKAETLISATVGKTPIPIDEVLIDDYTGEIAP